VFFASVL